MIRTSHDAPQTTVRAPDWRAQAACLTEPADLFFPDGTTGHWALTIEQAKAVCHRCPVADACLAFAEAIRATDGVYGGLTDKERASRRRHRNQTPIPDTSEEPAATLEEAFRRRSEPRPDGHLIWHGTAKFKWQGVSYNALHVAFFLHNGRLPEGPIRRSCTHGSCHTGAHLTDRLLRDAAALCGTLPGYYRHKRRGEAQCQRCKDANAASDRRLKTTGSRKATV